MEVIVEMVDFLGEGGREGGKEGGRETFVRSVLDEKEAEVGKIENGKEERRGGREGGRDNLPVG